MKLFPVQKFFCVNQGPTFIACLRSAMAAAALVRRDARFSIPGHTIFYSRVGDHEESIFFVAWSYLYR